MDVKILAALLSGGFVILGVLLNHLLLLLGERKIFIPGYKGRLSALAGKWEGKGYDVDTTNNTKNTYEISLDLFKRRKTIKGSAKVKSEPNENSFALKLMGGFYSDSYLKLEYSNTDKNVIQYGVFFLKLSSNGKKLNGKFLGYGHTREEIIEGHLEFDKVNLE